MDSIFQDVRHAFRQFGRNRGFTALALATLALGIGANTAMFSLADGLLFRRLPYPEPDRLVAVSEYERGGVPRVVYDELRRSHGGFAEVATSTPSAATLLGPSGAELVRNEAVSERYLAMLGVRPALGRGFVDDDYVGDRPLVAVLSYGFWASRFARDPGVVGRKLPLEEGTVEVVGVLPREFVFTAARPTPDLLTPLVWSPAQNYSPAHRVIPLARIAPAMGADAAQREIEGLWAGLRERYPEMSGTPVLRLSPLEEVLFGSARPLLANLLAATGFVLAIACTNVATLVLARGASRRAELAVRASLGAGRLRLARQLLTESMLLSLIGGALGLATAMLTFSSLTALIPQRAHAYRLVELGVDARVAAFSLVIAVVAGLVTSLAPAIGLTRIDLHAGLGSGSRSAGPGRVRGRTAVALQAALTLVLLVGASLMVRSFVRVRFVPLGFEPDRVTWVGLGLPRVRYPDDTRRSLFFERLLERARGLPGVESAALCASLAVNQAPERPIVLSRTPLRDGGIYPVTRDYFRTMGSAIVRGRDFNDADAASHAGVAIVNEAAARRFWPDEDALGKTFRSDGEIPRVIVGIVADSRQSYRRAAAPSVFVPLQPESSRVMQLVARSRGKAESLVQSLRSEVAGLDTHLVATITPVDMLMDNEVALLRFQATLVGAFAGLALALAGVGLFGVVSQAVVERTREIGIRMALGADPRSILGLIVRHALTPVGIGLVVGAGAAVALSRSLQGLLYEVPPSDPLAFSLAIGALVLVAGAACCGPAIRATRVDPAVALRYE